MRLYLVQHGDAAPREINKDRPLTEKGKKDSFKIAEFLKAAGIKIPIIWHSDKRRAIETAEIFSETVSTRGGTVEKKVGLAPNDPVNPIFSATKANGIDLMIIGHLPFLQKLASLALFNSEYYEVLRVITSGVVCLEEGQDGKWQIVFEMTPELLK